MYYILIQTMCLVYNVVAACIPVFTVTRELVTDHKVCFCLLRLMFVVIMVWLEMKRLIS